MSVQLNLLLFIRTPSYNENFIFYQLSFFCINNNWQKL